MDDRAGATDNCEPAPPRHHVVDGSPIEDALIEHGGIRAVAVIGVPHASLGEVPYAYVVLRPGIQVSVCELLARVRTALGGALTPSGIEFVEELPIATTGATDKVRLRQRYLARHGRS